MLRIGDPDPGWKKFRSVMWIFRILFLRPLYQFFGLNYLNALMRIRFQDPGSCQPWIRDGKRFLGSGKKHPGSATPLWLIEIQQLVGFGEHRWNTSAKNTYKKSNQMSFQFSTLFFSHFPIMFSIRDRNCDSENSTQNTHQQNYHEIELIATEIWNIYASGKNFTAKACLADLDHVHEDPYPVFFIDADPNPVLPFKLDVKIFI